MAAPAFCDVISERTPVKVVDLRPRKRDEALKSPEPQPPPEVSIIQHHPGMSKVIGTKPTHSLLLSSLETSKNPFFHEGAVYLPAFEELYFTSNLLQPTSPAQLPVVLISKVRLHRDPDSGDVTGVEWTKLRPPSGIPRAAFGADQQSGVFYMARGKPPVPVVTSYYGREFNSVHGVAVAPDGGIWFTDPCHGFEQDYRKRPQMPCHVYRLASRDSTDLRVVADGLGRPTCLAFSPDGGTLYITDTDAVHGDGNQDATRVATIYAYDVLERSGSPFLANRRVFAYALRGIPMGVKCDNEGNVFAGCADGLEVWNSGGSLLGVIEIAGGVSNFCFSPGGREMFLCCETRLYRLHFGVDNFDESMNFF
ncbi:hypothetical protein MAPG_01670 [Magnaporthiopsis poae ATCC 64411]|uniref:SMP-30/Gluconolactonase/LRE-like region domain-containing protein n=1 Tax=Magnaporthiopsis poae (strain ATCC 64411 / 73-15) TaxID=644358 RepID=A0A0C4DPB0_MAGP6|nr:hypothetical protein MAPG_01670 [Magnaporthiopsis poae ATCC 64411]